MDPVVMAFEDDEPQRLADGIQVQSSAL